MINFFLCLLRNVFYYFVAKINSTYVAKFFTKRVYEKYLANQSIQKLELSDYQIRILEELKKTGVCVIDNYWSSEDCELARASIDEMISNYPELVHFKSDLRIFGANVKSKVINKYYSDEFLGQIASAYNGEESSPIFTMAAKMPYIESNLGSGEGWHRDAFCRQFKSILYLSDVKTDNGPFQLIKNSHFLSNILDDIENAKLKYMQYRISEIQVSNIVKLSADRLNTFTGKAGTLLLIDTSSIHRGLPIKSGTRYAITNYYYTINQINTKLRKQFEPVAVD